MINTKKNSIVIKNIRNISKKKHYNKKNLKNVSKKRKTISTKIKRSLVGGSNKCSEDGTLFNILDFVDISDYKFKNNDNKKNINHNIANFINNSKIIIVKTKNDSLSFEICYNNTIVGVLKFKKDGEIKIIYNIANICIEIDINGNVSLCTLGGKIVSVVSKFKSFFGFNNTVSKIKYKIKASYGIIIELLLQHINEIKSNPEYFRLFFAQLISLENIQSLLEIPTKDINIDRIFELFIDKFIIMLKNIKIINNKNTISTTKISKLNLQKLDNELKDKENSIYRYILNSFVITSSLNTPLPPLNTPSPPLNNP